jgi:hypothetical protein
MTPPKRLHLPTQSRSIVSCVLDLSSSGNRSTANIDEIAYLDGTIDSFFGLTFKEDILWLRNMGERFVNAC